MNSTPIALSLLVLTTASLHAGTALLLAPDPAHPLRGTVRIEVEASNELSAEEIVDLKARKADVKPIEAILVFVDGKQFHQIHGTPRTAFDLDTTRFGNGPHELFAAFYSGANRQPLAATLRETVQLDNGRTLRDVRSRWRELRLAPRQTADLAPRFVFTDDTERPFVVPPSGGIRAAPPEGGTTNTTFSSADPSIATVSNRGIVTALAPGLTAVRIEARGRTNETRVIVDAPHGFPHFARDGHILTEYDPARSIFVRTLFGLSPAELDKTPRLAEAARAAGINALTAGLYSNPADNHQPDLESWQRSWQWWWETQTEQPAQKHGFSLVLTGDDLARNDYEMANTLTNPWASAAIQLAFTRARDSRRVVCVEMMDEVTAFWGCSPTPTDGRWQKKTPPIPDDAFVRLMAMVNAVSNRPPISWPMLGLSGTDCASGWLGDPAFSDYASLYWTYLDWRPAYPHGSSLPQTMTALERPAIGFLPALRRDAPRLLLTSICGPGYTKLVEGAQYQPGRDHLDGVGVRPELCAVEIYFAAATGMAGVRSYHFDNEYWKADRRNTKVGAGNLLQTGAEPFEVGTDRWQAMAAAFNLIQQIEPHLLQPQASAPDLGPTFVTGARVGKDSRLLIAINFSERVESALVDLGPYRYAGDRPIRRWRSVGAQQVAETISNRATDRVTFAAGETVVWLFESKATTKTRAPGKE